MTDWIAQHERFWHKVQVADCWTWTAGRFDDKYGCYWHEGKSVYAHRFAYELLVGPVATGLVLDHLCRNTLCVNPDHLEPVTNRLNVQRGISWNSMKSHCPQGHRYTDSNTYEYVHLDKRRQRMCKTCNADRQRARRVTIGAGR